MMKHKALRLISKTQLIGAIFCVFSNMVQAQISTTPANSPTLTDRVYFIGDSTMATQNGYGDAVCAWLKDKAECLNLAKNGRSSKSYREEGLWAQAIEKMKNNPKHLNQWVLIQFGHNDQPGKPGRSTNLATEYPQNLERYAQDARAIGANPVFVTPLIRRSFKAGQHQDDLIEWAQAMKQVALKLQVPLIDLHHMSKIKVTSVGEDQADQYAETPKGTPKFDRTHLGPLGACVFGAMVLNQLPVATQGAIKVTTQSTCD